MRCELNFFWSRPSFQFATVQSQMVWYGMVNVDLYSAIVTKVPNILRTTENCLDLSPIQLTSQKRTRQDSLVLSVSVV